MKTAYLALGSNLGDRLGLLTDAVRRLSRPGAIALQRVSSVYETAPVGLTEQPEFLNLVIAVATSLAPEALLAECLAVEAALGRVRQERWGARTIDVDLLWHDGAEVTTPTLTLPHPRMAERAFVLVPLAEIAPDVQLAGVPVAVLAERCDRGGMRNRGTLPLSGMAEVKP